MRWESLISTQNLKLAWRRINTGRNLQYKRFYRESYLVYEGAIDEHLRNLHRELKARVWEPKHATRVYLPKPSGLQRPLSLIDIEDQILLQAIANLVAKKLYNRRRRVELRTVFSNKLANPQDSIFFMERWQSTYQAFQKKCADVYEQGYRWSAHFDLAAYYDTISHDLLLKITSPRDHRSYALDSVRQWLQMWSADNVKAMTAHGIPQGPIASDFLAEAFFLPIDERLQKEDFCYLRYVDDIRLFGRSEYEVLQAALLLEQECRHRGLIPQSAKFEIRPLGSPEDAMGALPSISPSDNRGVTEPAMTVAEAQGVLSTAIDRRPMKVKDKARFRYVMYRAPADSKILNIVLKLLPRHPEHIDAFTAYFANFGKRRRIARVALTYLNSGLPYSYVRGELWHVIARLAGPQELEQAIPAARDDARNRSMCVVLSWGVMHFLMRCESEGLLGIGRRLAAEQPISRALLAPIFADREFTRKGHVRTLLKGSLMEQLAGARELQKRGVSLTSLSLRQRDLSVSCRSALLSLGVIRRRAGATTRDWISEILNQIYGCRSASVWRRLLGTEYEHALQVLLESKARFPGARSDWLGLQDSFNNIVIRQFFTFLQQKGMPGYSKIVDKKGELVKYGILIAVGGPFDSAYTTVASQLRNLHERRNKLPGSHPYDQKGGAKSKWLSNRERDSLVPHVKNALEAIAAVAERNP